MTIPQRRNAISIVGLDEMDEADRPAIAATLDRLFLGFALRDTNLLAGVYSADADWINAFGSVQRGAAEIIGYLSGLFADRNFNDGRLVSGPECTLRRLDADHALVRAHLRVAGQSLVGGGTIPLRDNHSIRVISRQPDGNWAIVSEMFMDARQDQSFVNQS